MEVTVRFAGPEDAEALAPLIAALMAHEGKRDAPPDPATIARWLDPAAPAFEALLGEMDGVPHGYLAFYRAFSLFKGSAVLQVENVYVDTAARGQGVARALLAAAAREAQRRGWRRLELNVSHENAPATGAYSALGFTDPEEGVRRLDDAALDRLAAQAGA